MSERKHLTDRELKFAQLVASGVTKREAIERSGYNPGSRDSASTMGTVVSRRPRVRQKIEELRKAQGRKLMEQLPEFLKEMCDLALGRSKTQGYNARVQFEALRDLLDRIPGMGKKEKIQISEEEFPAELLRMLNRLNADEGEA